MSASTQQGQEAAVTAAMQAIAAAVQAGSHEQVAAAVRAAPGGEQSLLRQLLERLFNAKFGRAKVLWQGACLAYLNGCSEEQLLGWRWRVEHWVHPWASETERARRKTAEVELVPYLLYASRAVLQAQFQQRLADLQNAYEEEYREDETIEDYSYLEGMNELSLEVMMEMGDSMNQRDRLIKPLLSAAVQRGTAALTLADARRLDEEREAKWEEAGAGWAEGWEPTAEAHGRFHPQFRRAVRALLLANHRGMPDANGAVMHLPREVLLKVLRHMSAPGMEAAWVPLVGELPDWVDLNSDMWQ